MEENRLGYYAIIPVPILTNDKLKANEKLLYAYITSLANKEGYCFASNKYFADCLNISAHTVSRLISNLNELGFVKVEIIRDETGQVIQRRIYIYDNPFNRNDDLCTKMNIGYVQNNAEGIANNIQYNNINYKIDRLFNYIIKKEGELLDEFKNVNFKEIIKIVERFDMFYTESMLIYFNEENLKRIKIIIYMLALIVKNKKQTLITKLNREKMIEIYNNCKLKEENINDFINYYYRSVVNEITK